MKSYKQFRKELLKDKKVKKHYDNLEFWFKLQTEKCRRETEKNN